MPTRNPNPARDRTVARRLLAATGSLLLALSTLASGCSEGTSGGGTSRSWQCFENPTLSCSCYGSRPGEVVFAGSSSPEVATCGDWNCCLLTDAEDLDCNCMKRDSCEAEAASRPGTTIVDTCPPFGEVAVAKCAGAGENCSSEYITQRQLSGCCGGATCVENGDGVKVCTAD